MDREVRHMAAGLPEADERPPKLPRERLVLAAAKLFRTQGVTGAGMRAIVESANAPRGSLQHYFPGGKDQLVSEALHFAGDFAGRRVTTLLDRMDDPTPAKLYAALVGEWRDLYLREGFAQGCPLAAAAVDTAASSPSLRAAVSEGLDRWQRPLEDALQQLGVPAARAPRVATLMMVGLEGSLILARSRADAAVIDTVIEELGPVLDAAVEPSRRPRATRPAGNSTGARPTRRQRR
jgi:AcrR family transcriptional regulator